ncbi:MULE domain-containing protein [Aphis craccivora]|uniref:MULE domain-containing protein n=1 Tax=Aphis craccivora TaxID=307492 RepID=A0A6G0YX38_APHCR|nr:MULE domain-containing protein [Aphis craccivora]
MKKLGYLQLVNNNEFALKSLKILMVLPLLLARRIEEGFIDIKQYAIIHHVNLRRLFNYYERFWLRKIGAPLLSVYKKKFRTNNNVESFHNKLRQTFQTSHPNIWAFLRWSLFIEYKCEILLLLVNSFTCPPKG